MVLLLKGAMPSTQNWPYRSDTSVLMGVPAGRGERWRGQALAQAGQGLQRKSASEGQLDGSHPGAQRLPTRAHPAAVCLQRHGRLGVGHRRVLHRVRLVQDCSRRATNYDGHELNDDYSKLHTGVLALTDARQMKRTQLGCMQEAQPGGACEPPAGPPRRCHLMAPSGGKLARCPPARLPPKSAPSVAYVVTTCGGAGRQAGGGWESETEGAQHPPQAIHDAR